MGICFSLSFPDENHYHNHPPPPPPATTAKVISINGQLREYRLPVLASQVLAHEEEQEEQEAASSSTPSSITSSTSTSASKSSSSSSPWILCDADLLTYEDYIPVMDSHSPLSPDHIYYVLLTSRLHRRLSSSDMAALAVKAALALQNLSSNSNSKSKAKKQNNINHNKKHSAESHGLLHRRPRRQNRVSPAVVVPLPAVLDNRHPSSSGSSTPHRQQATSSNYDDYYYEILNNNSIKAFDHQPKPQSQAPRRIASRSGSLRIRTSVQKYASGSRQTKFTAIRSFRLRLSTIYEGIIL